MALQPSAAGSPVDLTYSGTQLLVGAGEGWCQKGKTHTHSYLYRYYTVSHGALQGIFNNSSSPEEWLWGGSRGEWASRVASSSPDQLLGFHLFHLLRCPALSLGRPSAQSAQRQRCQWQLWQGTTQVSHIGLHQVESISCQKPKGSIFDISIR